MSVTPTTREAAPPIGLLFPPLSENTKLPLILLFTGVKVKSVPVQKLLPAARGKWHRLSSAGIRSDFNCPMRVVGALAAVFVPDTKTAGTGCSIENQGDRECLGDYHYFLNKKNST
jgi:hypothetical protein